MDILATSLEALLQRATNPENETEDVAAIEAFHALINKESEGIHIGVRLLAVRLHSRREKEALQALTILDTCMKKCGSAFHSEIGKFRFLNEMIKLVSPKYLGMQTPPSVRQAVLELLHKWTSEYNREIKIKEAYEMLKKQGVIKEDFAKKINVENSVARKTVPEKSAASIFQDEEKSKLLQKLLQSKNPDDLQAANRLIKTMVKEDDKRAELKTRRITELEAVHNNVRLLNEMLDSYTSGTSSVDELDLINELHQSCERLRPNVSCLAAETQQNEEMLSQVLQASDDLSQIFEKYTAVIIKGEQSLLDMELTDCNTSDLVDMSCVAPLHLQCESNLDVLCDIFSNASPNIPPSQILEAATCLASADELNEELNSATAGSKANVVATTKKSSAFQELDVLSENLLNEYLPSSSRKGHGQQFHKPPDKIPMNLLPKQQPCAPANLCMQSLTLAEGPADLLMHSEPNGTAALDDCLVDLAEGKQQQGHSYTSKSLANVSVRLENVRPSLIPPVVVLEENSNGISVILHFAKDKPRPDVTVMVVTTLNKNEAQLTNYLFQAVVTPKSCKLKLETPSGTELPPHNPFLPPSAITQILLISNPTNVTEVSLKFILSFVIEGETFTEMAEVERLPPFLT